jgi:hypothetical protein
MSDVTTRLDAIQARRPDIECDAHTECIRSDLGYLIGLARKQQAALDAALALAEEWRYKGEHGWGAWQEGHGPDPEGYALDGASADLRAAIHDALGADQ